MAAIRSEPETLASAPTEAQLVADASGLVSPPAICVRMFELIQSPRSSSEAIAELVSLDPNLTARLLRIVNSSYYGFPSKVDTVARAVTILGTRDLYNLVLAISAVRTFAGLGGGLVPMERFWHHSIFVAVVARLLAQRLGVTDPERFFVAGLLHDVGNLLIYSQVPGFRTAVGASPPADEAELHATELEHIGFTHASAGALLLETWQLPRTLRVSIRHHHDLGAPPEHARDAGVLHLADVLANRSGPGTLGLGEPGAQPEDPAVWPIIGAPPEAVEAEQLIDGASEAFAELCAILLRG